MLPLFSDYVSLNMSVDGLFSTFHKEFRMQTVANTAGLPETDAEGKRLHKNIRINQRVELIITHIESNETRVVRLINSFNFDMRLFLAIRDKFPESDTAKQLTSRIFDYPVALTKEIVEELKETPNSNVLPYTAHRGLRVGADSPHSAMLWNLLQDQDAYRVFATVFTNTITKLFEQNNQIGLDVLMLELKKKMVEGFDIARSLALGGRSISTEERKALFTDGLLKNLEMEFDESQHQKFLIMQLAFEMAGHAEFYAMTYALVTSEVKESDEKSVLEVPA